MTSYSYQLYSSRAFSPLSETFAMLAGLGYVAVEGYGALYGPDTDIATLRTMLDEAGLAMPTGHIGLDALESDPDAAIRLAKAMGMTSVFVPYLADEHRPPDATGWAAFGRRLAEAGKPVLDAGLGFGWHNHAFEFVDLGGEEKPLDLVLAASNDIGLELDVAWVKVAGEDPVKWVRKYSDRIISVHLKDIAPAGERADEDGWADVGHGTMDWAALIPELRKTSVRHWIMEHDNPNDHERFARRSIETARAF